MLPEQAKVGLALTGGGAKGAYHVGAIKAISEFKMPIDMVSGTSIGALNGAIIATAANMEEAHSRLSEIWTELASGKVIGISKTAPLYLSVLTALGVATRSMPIATAGAATITKIAEILGFDIPKADMQILDDSYLVTLLKKNTSPEAFKSGLPFYTSVYESYSGLNDLINVAKAILHLGNTQESEFLHIQSLPDSEMQKALMASAALPLLFRAQKIQGKNYTDGGQGDWYGVGGNTPVKPLVDAGCSTVIVVHLCDGSAWDRNKYPDVNIIEVRPKNSIARGNAAADVLGFDNRRIESWSEQGYQDAMHSLQRVFGALKKHNQLKQSSNQLGESLEKHKEPDNNLQNAMARLRGKL